VSSALRVSVAIKPHDAGLVWLYFLLAGGVYRKRALQTLLVTGRLGSGSHPVGKRLSRHIGCRNCTPIFWRIRRPAGSATLDSLPRPVRTVSMVIDLQSVVAVFRDDPRIL